jgi:hypothetical protein
MSLIGLLKTNSSALAGLDKTVASLEGLKKSGNGWDYDQPDITYDMTTDAEGREVLYDSVGEVTSLTGLDKTAV